MSELLIDAVGSNVPSIVQAFGKHHPVQGYIWQPGVLSYIPWTAAQLAEFPGHFLTATRPGRPQDARHARELDVETFDATADDVVPWLVARHDDFGHDDGQVYCDLSNLAGVIASIIEGGIYGHHWWSLRIAWYWGRPAAPTRDQVLTEANKYLAAASLPALEPQRLKICQWQAAGPYDKNAVYGPYSYTRP